MCPSAVKSLRSDAYITIKKLTCLGRYPTVSPLSVYTAMKSMQDSITHSEDSYFPHFTEKDAAAKRDRDICLWHSSRVSHTWDGTQAASL